MKNDHFLKLSPEGQLGPPVGKESVTKNHFLKLSQEQASYHIFAICFKNFFTRNSVVDVKQMKITILE